MRATKWFASRITKIQIIWTICRSKSQSHSRTDPKSPSLPSRLSSNTSTKQWCRTSMTSPSARSRTWWATRQIPTCTTATQKIKRANPSFRQSLNSPRQNSQMIRRKMTTNPIRHWKNEWFPGSGKSGWRHSNKLTNISTTITREHKVTRIIIRAVFRFTVLYCKRW